MADSNEVDLLLIGKTGTGKSATGNSILKQRNVFKCLSSSSSVTTRIQYEVSLFRGRIIKVVDGPGVGDTRLNDKVCIKSLIKEMANAIALNPRGYHAFLLVVRFGCRFTKEDIDTVEFLKHVFGKDFVKNFCILLMTCGDNFENESEETGKSFLQWCGEQQGPLQQLMKECDNRVVLFDNVTKVEEKKNKQIENLLHVVDNLSSRGRRYTNKMFEQAKHLRDRFMVENMRSVIQDETMTETSLILSRFKEVQEITDLREKIEQFQKLQVRVEALHKKLVAQDQGTGALHDLCSNVETLERTIKEEVTLCKKTIEERENAKRREEETRRKFEENIKLLKEAHDRSLKEGKQALEKYKKCLAEQERQREEMEERNKKIINEITEKHRQEEAEMRRKYEQIIQSYNRAKDENVNGIWKTLLQVVTYGLSAACSFLIPGLFR